jgi:hypothetical protein
MQYYKRLHPGREEPPVLLRRDRRPAAQGSGGSSSAQEPPEPCLQGPRGVRATRRGKAVVARMAWKHLVRCTHAVPSQRPGFRAGHSVSCPWPVPALLCQGAPGDPSFNGVGVSAHSAKCQ